jgi:hypothetical protein
VIKIRYACLPEGLHATAVARGRRLSATYVYLQPGLQPWQRRNALRRLRRDARLGHAPPLPAAGLARALAADRVLTALRILRAAVACHPLGTLGLAGALAGAAVSYLAFITPPPPGGPGAASAGPVPASGLPSVPAADVSTGPGLAMTGPLPLLLTPRRWRVPEAVPRHRAQAGWHPAAAPSRPHAARQRHGPPGRWRLRHRPGRWPGWFSRLPYAHRQARHARGSHGPWAWAAHRHQRRHRVQAARHGPWLPARHRSHRQVHGARAHRRYATTHAGTSHAGTSHAGTRQVGTRQAGTRQAAGTRRREAPGNRAGRHRAGRGRPPVSMA